MNHSERCEKCEGSGMADNSEVILEANGRRISITKLNQCKECGGSGRISRDWSKCDCEECHGSFYLFHGDVFIAMYGDVIHAMFACHEISLRDGSMAEVYWGGDKKVPVFRCWGSEYQIGRMATKTLNAVAGDL